MSESAKLEALVEPDGTTGLPHAWLQQFAEEAGHAVLVWSAGQKQLVFANACAAELFGAPRESFTDGSNAWLESVEAGARERVQRLIEEWPAGAANRTRMLRYPVRQADGSERHARHSVTGIFGSKQELQGAISFIIDDSAAEHALEALRQSEAKYRAIFEQASVGIFQSTLSGRFINMNSACARLVGYATPHEAVCSIRNAATDVYANPADRQRVLDTILQAQEFSSFTLPVKNRSGERLTIELHARVVRDPAGSPLYMEGFVEDVTERHSAAEALRASEERLRLLLQQLPAVIWTVDRDLVVTSIRGAAITNLGEQATPLVGSSIEEIGAACQPADSMLLHHQSALQGGSSRFDVSYAGRWYESHVEPLRGSSGEIDGVIGVALDLTERRSAERERDRLFQNSHDLLAVLDMDGAIRQTNRAWHDTLGLDPAQLSSARLCDLVHEKDRKTAELVLHELGAGHKLRFFEIRLRCAEDSYRWISWNGFSLPEEGGLYLQGRDVTEQRQLEAERRELERYMQHAEKLESLGVLAGGIAHDFNNLLTAILGHTQMALARTNAPDRVERHLAEIEKAARRASEVTKEMLSYAERERSGTHEPICLSALVRSMAGLLESSCPSNARFRYELAEGLPLVQGVTPQLWQTIVRLTINAAEAIGREPGYIDIKTGTARLSEPEASRLMPPGGMPPGMCVFVEIEDTGQGMSEEELQRLFDPYFSTKDGSRGLGLSAALGIVRSHRGAFQISSQPGKGTRVRVLLPPLANAGN